MSLFWAAGIVRVLVTATCLAFLVAAIGLARGSDGGLLALMWGAGLGVVTTFVALFVRGVELLQEIRDRLPPDGRWKTPRDDAR